MTEIEALLSRYKSGQPDIKSGSLRFFGDDFGRPGDNQHTIVGIDYQTENDCLIIRFNAGETLFVWQAQGIKADKDNFLIQAASRVRWEWFYYGRPVCVRTRTGRPQTPDNLYYQQYTVKDGEVEVTHNIDWYNPVFDVSLAEPAVMI